MGNISIPFFLQVGYCPENETLQVTLHKLKYLAEDMVREGVRVR